MATERYGWPPARRDNEAEWTNWRTCPTCNGRGVNPVHPSILCPKCKGERRIRKRRFL
jgi:DnaJ-class molecular chaperone